MTRERADIKASSRDRDSWQTEAHTRLSESCQAAGIAEALGRSIGDARRLALPAEVAAVRGNLLYLRLARALTAQSAPPDTPPAPEDVAVLVRETFRSFGIFLVEFLRSLTLPPSKVARGWQIKGIRHLEELAASPGGWILAGAHTGNWEHLGALGAILGRRIVAPTDLQFHPLISGIVKRAKQRRGVISVPTGHGLRGLIRALERGDLVAFPLDGGCFRRGAAVRLLGRRVRLAAGAARLSLLSGRPILPVFSRRVAFMKQQLDIHPAIYPPGTLGGAPVRPTSAGKATCQREAARVLTQQTADLLGQHLLNTRGQWCIFRSIVPETVPEGEVR